MRISLVNRSRWQDRKGQALVEFALVVPLLLLFLLGIIQMGLLFNGFITIQQAARIGVREASLGDSPKQAIINQVNQDNIFPVDTPVKWTVTGPSSSTTSTTTSNLPQTVTVSVAAHYPLLIGIPGFGQQVPITQQYTMVVEVDNGSQTPNGCFEAGTNAACSS
jgi:Flp pilus assembly protein TadG